MRRLKSYQWFVTICVLGCLWPTALGQLKGRPAEEWIERLEREERVKNIKIGEVIRALSLEPGTVIADLGAGSGLFTREFSKAVSPGGRVFAVDIDKGLLKHIRQSAKKEKLKNIKTILGKYEDPRLKRGSVDIAFFHDVLHHIENRRTYLLNVAKGVKPDGRVVIIDIRMSQPGDTHYEDEELHMSREEVQGWMSEAGFELEREVRNVYEEGKYFLVFKRTISVSNLG